jgi:hypothetical protein
VAENSAIYQKSKDAQEIADTVNLTDDEYEASH